jgi:hypothetical protein
MRRSENIILFTCLLFAFVSCKTVKIDPEYKTQEIEKTTQDIINTTETLTETVSVIETTGVISPEQITVIKTATVEIKEQAEKLREAVEFQTNAIEIVTEQNAGYKAEIIALETEKERAESKRLKLFIFALIISFVLLLHIIADVFYVYIKVKGIVLFKK